MYFFKITIIIQRNFCTLREFFINENRDVIVLDH